MTIPFLDLVRKAKEKFEAKRRPAGLAPLPSVQDKPESDKLAKRVMPYAVRTMTPEPSAPALAASAIATRRISVTRPSAGAPPDLGPRVGVSVDPRGERTLSLALSDVIAEMPNGYLKPHESFDTSRRITLKAAEVEKGLAAGRPSISIAAIYQQVPEIFLHTVQPSDTAVVMLPAKKVIDELSHLRVREDQTAEPVMAQVETAFLKMMVEESAKFGTKLEPFTTTELPPLPEPVSSAPAAAEPAPVAAIRPPPASPSIQPPPAMKLPVQPPPAVRPPAQPPPVAPATSRTIPPPGVETEPTRDGSMARITFVAPSAPAENKPEKSLPIGTGEPAFPRVPASSGPPVPPAAPPAAAPTRIPFQMPPSAVPPKVAAQTPAPAPPTTSAPVQETPKIVPVAATSVVPTQEPMVVLPLCPILASLPPMQVAGDVASVPADAKISFRIALIAPQLATGKVTIPPKDFHAALPEQYRGLFLPDVVEAPVQLSLPDVLANLPGDSLRMREDQEVTAQDETFETPFSAKAKEDAERFAQGRKTAHPSAAAPSKPAVPKAETPKIELPKAAEAEVPKVRAPDLQIPKVAAPKIEAAKVELSAPVDAFRVAMGPAAKWETARPAEGAPKFDAKAAIALACALPGVASCSVIFTDGLIIAGNIPDEMHMEGLSAVAPTMLQKLQKHMCETQLGPLSSITVHGQKSPVTFFGAGDLCLTAVHNGVELSAESRRELGRITQELSRTYPKVETPHVDH
jgi:predicted regulator of Ras-like GTPase activity (Roadblock/LC7/MglB family)